MSEHHTEIALKIAIACFGIALAIFGLSQIFYGRTAAGIILLVSSVFAGGIASPIMALFGTLESIGYIASSDREF
jgi:TM2 domain-containing membrane protein YozV